MIQFTTDQIQKHGHDLADSFGSDNKPNNLEPGKGIGYDQPMKDPTRLSSYNSKTRIELWQYQ
jgi:hypothetical protein